MENIKSSRRDFLKKSSLVGLGLSTTILTACEQQQDQTEKKELGVKEWSIWNCFRK